MGIWTNEGLWPGRTLKIPILEAGVSGLDLSGSETMSTDSQITGCSSHSSSDTSRRLSNNDSGLFPDSPVSLPLTNRSPRNQGQMKLRSSSIVPISTNTETNHRASIGNLSDFLSKMDSSIAVNKKNTISLIQSSHIDEDKSSSTITGGDTSLNNTNTRLSDFGDVDDDVSVSLSNNDSQDDGRGARASVGSLHQTVRGYQGYQNIC